jgi:hypothetical protein
VSASESPFTVVEHETDLCVVGGGMAGLAAAIAAARGGARVVLMHERPVLGGNASSEIRVHVCGADRHNRIPNLRETGILEEIRLQNAWRNPLQNYAILDSVLYELARAEPNLTLLLNCSCNQAEMDGPRIAAVTGWQMTTQSFQRVHARIFADCSGDAVLAPLSGAAFRMGREARSEFDESLAPEKADRHTMGMTCLFQAREYPSPQPFIPPAWAHTLERCEDLPYGPGGHDFWRMGYWWAELGGEYDIIADAEWLRDECLKITYGIWDHIKNSGRHDADNWALEWVAVLPGKRESRRYVGAHVLTQNDIESEGRFHDVVAYGGWSMDDHHPAGFHSVKIGAPATIFHHAPSPYGIPYRCLYARRIENLMFAGRCASATHMAMSSTRVAATCAVMGQAVGTAAALAVRRGILPRDVLAHVPELQQRLLADDCYLPWTPLQIPHLTARARLSASRGDPEPVRDGWGRPIGDDPHAWTCEPGDTITAELAEPARVESVTLTLDSDLAANIQQSMSPHSPAQLRVPASLPRRFRLEGRAGGRWRAIAAVEENRRRHVPLPVDRTLDAVRFTLEETWGAPATRLFGFYLR